MSKINFFVSLTMPHNILRKGKFLVDNIAAVLEETLSKFSCKKITPLRIGHFTVVCSATKPMDGCEATGDLALIQTSLLLSCKLCCCNAN